MSNINYLSINENFPVAGQDNDTQVFRDNFDTIKNSLRAAQEEITDLQNNSAPLDADANFRGNRIEQAKLKNVVDELFGPTPWSADTLDVSFTNGNYQSFILTRDTTIGFTEFPGDSAPNDAPIGVGKVRLELKSSAEESRTVTFTATSGTTFKKNGFTTVGTSTATSFSIAISSSTDPVVIEVWRYELDNIYIRNLGTFE